MLRQPARGIRAWVHDDLLSSHLPGVRVTGGKKIRRENLTVSSKSVGSALPADPGAPDAHCWNNNTSSSLPRWRRINEMAQVRATPKTYDVIVVGSGAGGGVAAHVLSLSGAQVCMLEAGGWYDGTKQSDMFKWPYNAPHRGAGTKEKPFGYYDA